MNKLKVILTEKAKADIIEIRDYIAENNRTAAKEFVIKLRKAFINLAVYPRIGKCRPEFSGMSDVLFLTVLRKYLIVYSIKQGQIYIVRVLSNYQNICALL